MLVKTPETGFEDSESTFGIPETAFGDSETTFGVFFIFPKTSKCFGALRSVSWPPKKKRRSDAPGQAGAHAWDKCYDTISKGDTAVSRGGSVIPPGTSTLRND